MRVWLPEPAEMFEGLPDGLDVDVYDGSGDPPASIAQVEFYVTPYMAGPHTVTFLQEMPALKVVQTLTAGVDHILPLVPPGVTLCNARGVHDASTAELGVALMLASLRGIPDYVRAQDAHRWAADVRPALADKTVLIVGYGSIGQALERRLLPFECDVLRVARRSRAGVHTMDELPDLLPRADVVVLLLPMTDHTRGLVDAKFLAGMRDGAVLVNLARGAVVDTEALVAELSTGRIKAALDVTDPEPLPPGHPLWDAPGVLISPHVGGNTSALVPRARRLVSAQLRRYAAGEPLENVITGPY